MKKTDHSKSGHDKKHLLRGGPSFKTWDHLKGLYRISLIAIIFVQTMMPENSYICYYIKPTYTKVTKGTYLSTVDEETLKALVFEHGAVVTG